jgi:putative protease
MTNKIELLAPVGSFPMLRAAIDAGADAVYLGIKNFNMRDSAKNFSIQELKKIKKIAEKNNIKIYLTLNTIIYDKEIPRIEKILQKIKKQNLVDAVICWDFSVINLCKKYEIPFHISTQASVSNSEAAGFYKKLGAQRIILARELNLRQIKNIVKKTGIQVECFIHGAMCVSISGRCFTSQFLQNKSANRGQCSHPCRRQWKIIDPDGYELKLHNNRVMSAKDLCTLPFLYKLKKVGIKAFKIEGRNRSPEYVHKVVSIYRKALDKNLSPDEIKKYIEELKKVYNRGFSDGFYLHTPTSDDFSTSENGEQKQVKYYVGKVEKYWPKPKVAAVRLQARGIKLGDKVYIIGDETGIKKTIVKSIEINHKKIKKASKKQLVGIKLPKCKKGDKIYIIKNKY